MLQVVWQQFQTLLGLGLDVADVGAHQMVLSHDHHLRLDVGNSASRQQAFSGPGFGVRHNSRHHARFRHEPCHQRLGSLLSDSDCRRRAHRDALADRRARLSHRLVRPTR